ncbi:uncharacterized protein LOC127282161 [Leptopilina boulardi]|uniref:uncharacterized protein LOC127282161 n=1 Tax=Leptopilina boulardi TaxID=63433 RepID=UPI0021F50FB0|nr:uncharacterized protein LOC127282161 [Leptopilina boulardi]
MTYIDNPGPRIQRWRIRLQNYQYKFEYKPGKINRIVEALSTNPADRDKTSRNSQESDWSDTSSLTSDTSDPMTKTPKDTDDNKELTEGPSENYRAFPIKTRSSSRPPKASSFQISQEDPVKNPKDPQEPPAPSQQKKRKGSLKEGLRSVKSRVDSNLPHRSILKAPATRTKNKKGSDTPSQWTAKLGGLASTSNINRPAEIKMTLLRRPTDALPSPSAELTGIKYPVPDAASARTFPDVKGPPRPRGRPKGTTKSKELCYDQPYAPPARSIITDADKSCIAERLRPRKGPSVAHLSSDPSSSTNEASAEDDSDSDPLAFRKDHSVFPHLPPDPEPIRSTISMVTSPQGQNPISCSLLIPETYTDVYVDGACGENGGTSPRAGIGVWFGPDNPLNVSKRYKGRQTNNASEIEAAAVAARQARKAEIQRLRIKTDSQYLVHSVRNWIPRWHQNGWKTAEN